MAKRFEALNRLWEKVRDSNHDFRPTTELFPSLDVERVARDLDLEARGKERGAENRPPKTAKALDDVELSIIERIEQERKTAHHTLEDQQHLFDQRLTNLDFGGQFGLIRQANAASVSDFKAEVVKGRNELHGLRRALYEAEQENVNFKRDHHLKRAARVSEGPVYWLKVSIIVFLLLVETIMNGVFLAEGSDLGLVGGVTEALVFSVLNIGIALLAAIFCVRLVTHAKLLVKLLGTLSIVGYTALAVTLNLALAHYRELSGTDRLSSEVGRLVIDRLHDGPYSFADVKSWLLFGIGLLFSVVAFIDGWFFTDPYPGYAGVERRLRAARKNYKDRMEELIEDLRDVRDEHNKKAGEIIRDLNARHREHNAIVGHRAKLLALFAQHQSQLQRTAHTLLGKYREANRLTRTAPAPKYFESSWNLERIDPARAVNGEGGDDNLVKTLAAAQQELSEQVKRIGQECEAGIEQYHQLDKLFPEAVDG